MEKALRNKFGDNLEKLGCIADVVCGPFGSAITSKDYRDAGIPLVRITNISKQGYMNYSDIVYIDETLADSLFRTQVSEGDLVISQRGTLGQCAVVDGKFKKMNISANIIAVKNIKGLSAQFIRDYLLSSIGQMLLERNMSGQVQQKITTQDIADIIIPINIDCKKLTQIIQNGYISYIEKFYQANKIAEVAEENAIRKANDALQWSYDLRKSITKSFADSIDIKIPNNSSDVYSAIKLLFIKNNDTRRMDPKCYSKKFEILRKEIASSPYKKYTLSELILSNISGDWGKDDNVTDENSVRCLVLRSTEISNKHNIEIREDKVQFRLLDKKKFKSMQMEIGDIIVEKSGGSIDQPVGRVVYLDRLEYNDTPIAYSNFLTKLKVNRELVDPYYLFEYLRFVYNIGLTEVMQNQTNGIRNLIVSEFLAQTIIVPENNKEIGLKMKAIREQAKMMELEAEQEWQKARAQFEKELLGEQ